MVGRVFVFLVALTLFTVEARGADNAIPLRQTACIAAWDNALVPAPDTLKTLPFACDATAAPRTPHWTWFRLDVGALAAMPADWRLLVVQSRFDHVALMAVARDGRVQRIVRPAGGLDGMWAPGGLLRFPVAIPGRDLAGLYLGFDRLDAASLVRAIDATSNVREGLQSDRWLILMGLFAGALLSAFAYNLPLLDRGRRYPFQRWYLAWIAVALAYGITWSNMLGFVSPAFVGPAASRADYVLVGLMIGIGSMFFVSLIEERLLPAWLRHGGRAIAVSGVLAGGLAALDPPGIAAVDTDRLLNHVVIAGTLFAFAGIAYAIRHGSRIVWFYVVGWAPVIAIFALRVLRNLGCFSTGDFMDRAMFAGLAFETVVLSLATAHRFRSLRRELTRTVQGRERDLIEAAALRRTALTDPLTGLGNRAAFQQALQARIETPSAAPFVLFLIDVDHLKDVNDRLGHTAGDAFLCHIASRLADLADVDIFAGRLGGDEFAVIAPGGSPRTAQIEERIAAVQGLEWRHAGDRRAISLSVGSATFPADGDAADLLYHNADLALYHAKRLGRALHHRYEPILRTQEDSRTAFAADAAAAIDRDEFQLHLQPIRDLRTDHVVAYEALLRWQHPERGLLAPGQFADLLVEQRIGLRVQDHVLDRALRLLRADPAGIPVLNVNFTAAQLTGPDAARHVLGRLDHFGVAPRALCIEVTEGVMFGRAADGIAETLHALHDAGIRIALDDFGTGHASLSHLRDLPVDVIKIDQSFVAGLGREADSAEEIVRAIIGLAHGLGLRIVAEGVETEAQRNRLMALRCRHAQGYHIGRPAPWQGDRIIPATTI